MWLILFVCCRSTIVFGFILLPAVTRFCLLQSLGLHHVKFCVKLTRRSPHKVGGLTVYVTKCMDLFYITKSYKTLNLLLIIVVKSARRRSNVKCKEGKVCMIYRMCVVKDNLKSIFVSEKRRKKKR